jgi:hypothetical protein
VDLGYPLKTSNIWKTYEESLGVGGGIGTEESCVHVPLSSSGVWSNFSK